MTGCAAFATTAGSQLRRQLRVVGIEVAPGELVPRREPTLPTSTSAVRSSSRPAPTGRTSNAALPSASKAATAALKRCAARSTRRRIRAFVAFRQAGQSDGIERAIGPRSSRSAVRRARRARNARRLRCSPRPPSVDRVQWLLHAVGTRDAARATVSVDHHPRRGRRAARSTSRGHHGLPPVAPHADRIGPRCGAPAGAAPRTGSRSAGAALTLVVVALLVLWPAWAPARARLTADDDAGARRLPPLLPRQ